MGFFLQQIALVLIAVITKTSYAGIFILMALESANIPIPSEVVVPFSGFLAWKGTFTFLGVVLAATFGNILGSWVSYEIGARGGRPFLERYGKFFLITKHDLELATRLFVRFGPFIILAGRMLPVVRTFISFPAGIAHMRRGTFLFYTGVGSLPWNVLLGYAGFVAGENWFMLEKYFRMFDWAIGIMLIAAIVWWIRRHARLLQLDS